MIRRRASSRCVRLSSGVFKRNLTCFIESSLVLRRIFEYTQKPSTRVLGLSLRGCQGRRKQDSQSQNLVDHVLRCEEHCTQEILATWPDNQQSTKSCRVCFVQCSRRDENCGGTNRGSCTTIMNQLTTPWASGSSYLNGTSPYVNRLPIHLILLREPFFLFPKLKGSVLKALRLIRGPQRQSWESSQKNPSSSA